MEKKIKQSGHKKQSSRGVNRVLFEFSICAATSTWDDFDFSFYDWTLNGVETKVDFVANSLDWSKFLLLCDCGIISKVLAENIEKSDFVKKKLKTK